MFEEREVHRRFATKRRSSWCYEILFSFSNWRLYLTWYTGEKRTLRKFRHRERIDAFFTECWIWETEKNIWCGSHLLSGITALENRHKKPNITGNCTMQYNQSVNHENWRSSNSLVSNPEQWTSRIWLSFRTVLFWNWFSGCKDIIVLQILSDVYHAITQWTWLREIETTLMDICGLYSPLIYSCHEVYMVFSHTSYWGLEKYFSMLIG